MSCFILSALFGAVCMTIILAGADAVDWTRFKSWVSVQYERVTRYATAIMEKIRARGK
jgi:hypothetical protein